MNPARRGYGVRSNPAMNKTSIRRTAQTLLMLTIMFCGIHSPAQTTASFQIEGTVTRPDDGCNQAVVVLCDLQSGEPICRQTAQPFTLVMGTTNDSFAMDWLQAIPDAADHFQFTNLSAGNYIVVAQAWKGQTQPTNLMKFRGETIHLLGREEVIVPSDSARKLKLTAPGTNTIQFDQQFGNDDGFLMLGTRPQRGDPVLAWLGWGTNFIRHLIGFNSMPAGRTTVHGLPAETYASIFMPDDSPGFGSTKLHFGETNAVNMPIVASWSDGYKIPPTNLVWLVELLQTNRFKIDELLGIASKPKASVFEKERDKARLLLPIWEKEIVLPTGQKTRVVDLLTALGYARLSGKSKN
jgi:hypothetical protein